MHVIENNNIGKIDCERVEDLMSMYLENEVSEEIHARITEHLEDCGQCRELKEKIEELLYAFPDLEEDVPFFLKNRLYYIPEAQEEEYIESRYSYMRWVAAVVGTFVLFLNLFYFTNIYPPANLFLNNAASEVKTFAVKAGAFIEKVVESKGMFLFSVMKKDSDGDPESDETNDKSKEKKSNEEKEGGKNGEKKTGTN